jgi:parallel beta-helix repeat protein
MVSASPPPGFTPSALVVRNSTIANNRSTNSGSSGGGIVLINFNGTLLVQNSTITGNTANSVLAGQGGGGIARTSGTGTITLANTVVSGNASSNAPDLLSTGTVNVNFSAIGSAAGFTPSGSSGNNLAFGADLRLGTHGNFGGVTQTFFPRQASPLINAGSNALIPGGVSTDQRGSGSARVNGAAVDIGAVETQNLIIVTNTFNGGAGSLADAINQANTTSIIDNIIFDTTVFAGAHTITLTTALPVISNNLTIFGPGASLLTVRRSPGAPNFAVFNATAGIVNLFGMTVSNANAPVDGGGVTMSGTGRPNVTLDGMVVTGNNALQDGAGVNMTGPGFLTVRNSTISGNTAVEDGGGIYFLSGGSLVIENSTVSGNVSSGDDGGGIYFFGIASLNVPVGFTPGVLVVRNSTIANNTAGGGSGSGGGGIGLLSFTGTLLVQNSTITGNTANATLAGSGGGGIGRQSGTGSVILQNSIVSGNTNVNGPDLFFSTANTINANFSAIGSATGNFALSGTSGNNLAFGTNLMLGTLGNNGGPTQTILPSAISPLLGTGSNALVPAGLVNDQRGPGFARISAAVVDIGAAERDDLAPTVQTSNFLFLTAPQSLQYVFSENIGATLAVADLLLENLTTVQTVANANIAQSFDTATNTATFTFPGFPLGALPDGNYRATLIASGIADTSGNPLDGDGNGTAGDNHFFNFFFLNADANRDRSVDIGDFSIVATRFNLPGTFSQGNFNYDALTDIGDFAILASKFNTALPAPSGLPRRTSIASRPVPPAETHPFSSTLLQSRNPLEDDAFNHVLN